MTGALLSVRDVTIAYPTENGLFTAVERVTFSVLRGERFVLLGPSGCGKSTLLYIVGGFVAPSSGAVRVNDAAVTGRGRIAGRCSRSLRCSPGRRCSAM